ncbi:MAG TPA: DNA-directed RNA polymerase subunit beta [Virgibacillus sp.]|nr:DNA-directed RNA polymerase subunit beta [Virgibacillus sp.]
MSTNRSKQAAQDTQSKKQKNKSKKNKQKSQAAETRKQQKVKRKQEKIKQKKPRRRIFPIWLRIIIVVLLCSVALIAGAMVGYGVLGDGAPKDILKKETWQHIIDIVVKE